jgi:hypothetical protein
MLRPCRHRTVPTDPHRYTFPPAKALQDHEECRYNRSSVRTPPGLLPSRLASMYTIRFAAARMSYVKRTIFVSFLVARSCGHPVS